jgi:tetratricopeptide (TPR) repeat protein
MEPPHPPDGRGRWRASAPLASHAGGYPALEVALAAFICFLPSVTAGYAYDDLLLIRDNRYAHGLDQLPRAFMTHFWQIGAGGRGSLSYYRPIVTVTYILNWVMSGGKPWLFHLFNVALHALTTYLVLRVAERWTGRTVLAVAVAAIFALHPSRTESVEWISGRTDVLMTLFLLLSVEVTHWGALRPDVRARSRAFAVSILFFGMALLSKESAAILPLLLLADVLSTADRPRQRALVSSLVLHTVVAVGYLGLRMRVFPLGPGRAFAFTPRYGLLTVFAYAERLVVPWPQTFFHRPLLVERGAYLFPLPLVIAGAVVLALSLVLLLITYQKDRVAALLLVAAASALGPLLNFTDTGISVTTSDRFLYLPLFLFLAGLARRYGDFLSARARARGVKVAFGGLLSVYLAIDVLRVPDYRDQEAFYRHELRLNPRNPQALRAMSEVSAHAGHIDEAFELLRLGSSPESTRYSLLLPEWRLYENYLRMLGLMAAMTADGNVRDLTLLYRELDALLAGRTKSVSGRVGELELGRHVTPSLHAYTLQYGTRDILSAEAGILATRLGDDVHARELLGSISDEHVDALPNVRNIALAYARLEDFPRARHWMEAQTRSSPEQYREGSQAPEKGRLVTAEVLFRRAANASGMQRRRLRADAFRELGGYLRALRELRPAYDQDPTSPAVGPLYLHLLVAAGLEHEALAVAVRALGPARGGALVERARAGMSERLRSLRRPEEPSDWYVPEPWVQ